MIEDIVKNSAEFKSVLSDIVNNREAHSYLFSSLDKEMAKAMSRAVANALLCHNLCDKCENCVKFKHEHPDVKYFPKKNQLMVEDSNFIVEESFIKPIFADKKIFIIDDFDNSTPASQNKLLKVLEEPNENMYYLLSTSNPENILPTIKSRCFKVEIKKVDDKLIESEMKCTSKNIKEICVALSQGYVGRALELEKTKNLEEIFGLAVDIICSLKSSKEVLVYSKALNDQKDSILLIFEIISLLLEDLIALKLNQKNILRFKFIENKLNCVTGEYSLKAITEIEDLLKNSVKEIKLLGNPTLIVDNFLMNLLEVKYLCR